MQFLPGDVVLTRSREGWLGKVVRWFEGRPGDPARFNHGEIITKAGDERTARVVGALWHVLGRSLWDAYGPPAGKNRPEILVYRIVGLTDEQRAVAAARAESLLGANYGWPKLFAHAADRWLTAKAGREVYAFRLLLKGDEHAPICSLLVQFALGAFVNWFNVPEGTADPDTLDDFRAPGVTLDVFGPGLLGAEVDGARV